MRLLLSFIFIFTLSIPAQAISVLQMNLAEMTNLSEKIFRGTLVNVAKTKVEIGGGKVSAVVYTFDIKELFKGEVPIVNDKRTVNVKMIGTLQKQKAHQRALSGIPLLNTGFEYLLMVAPAGQTGLTTMMGLGQGAFRIFIKDKTEVAVNEFNNMGLFPNAKQFGIGAPVTTGAISYVDLADQIHTLIEK